MRRFKGMSIRLVRAFAVLAFARSVEAGVFYRQGLTEIQGRPAVIEVALRAESGGAADAVAHEALRRRDAEPLDVGPLRENPPQSFTCGVFCFTWPQFADAPRKKNAVTQYYNASGDPSGGGGVTALAAAQATWSDVRSTAFGLALGGATDRCPSLGCAGAFDGFNDVGWLEIDPEGVILAVTTYGIDVEAEVILEADIVLNNAPAVPWHTDGQDFDLESTVLHELGHLAGLGHTADPSTVMFPIYVGVLRQLSQSEIDGLEFFYPKASHPPLAHPLKPPPPIAATLVATAGDPAPGGGQLDAGFSVGGLNDAGLSVFSSSLLVDGEYGGEAVLRFGAGTLAILARSGEPAPGGGTLGLGNVGPGAIADDGQAVFDFLQVPFARPVGVNGGVFRVPADGVLQAAVVGGAFRGARDAHTADGDEIVFAGFTETDAGIFGPLGLGAYRLDALGAVRAVAAPGDAGPGDTTFDHAAHPRVNAAGAVAFEGHLVGDACQPNSTSASCRRGMGVYLAPAAGGTIVRIAGPGDAVPGDRHYLQARGPVLNDRGEVLFAGDFQQLADEGFSVESGLFVYRDGAIRIVALPGEELAGGGHLRETNFASGGGISNWALNDAGDLALVASLRERNPVAPAGLEDLVNNAVYLERGGRFELVARAGTKVHGLGTIQLIGSLHVDPIDPQESFIAPSGVALNNRGQLLFAATLTDGRFVLLLVQP